MSYDTLLEARIGFGNAVVVVTDENGLECEEDAVVIRVPQGPGDLWEFQSSDGSVFAINPYSNHFIRIEKATKS